MDGKHIDTEQISSNLRRLRESRGVSQENLAATIGIEQTALSHWETGKRGKAINTLQKLATFYGVTIDELLNTELAPADEVIQ